MGPGSTQETPRRHPGGPGASAVGGHGGAPGINFRTLKNRQSPYSKRLFGKTWWYYHGVPRHCVFSCGILHHLTDIETLKNMHMCNFDKHGFAYVRWVFWKADTFSKLFEHIPKYPGPDPMVHVPWDSCGGYLGYVFKRFWRVAVCFCLLKSPEICKCMFSKLYMCIQSFNICKGMQNGNYHRVPGHCFYTPSPPPTFSYKWQTLAQRDPN